MPDKTQRERERSARKCGYVRACRLFVAERNNKKTRLLVWLLAERQRLWSVVLGGRHVVRVVGVVSSRVCTDRSMFFMDGTGSAF